MKKSPKKLRATAFCFLLVITQNILMPAVSFALSSSPQQPEYSSYESVGTTDMVNLITGDFTYNMPLLSVPGPEGGFPIPLSYHAGIGLEEDASWVGLGFALNVGAVNRFTSQYPDDSHGDQLSTHFNNSGGNGFSLNLPVGSLTYDSEKGYGGSIGFGSLLSVGLGTQKGFSAVGVTFSSRYEKGYDVDPMGVAMSALTLAAYAAGPVGAVANTLSTFASYTALGAALITGNSNASMADWSIKQRNYLNVFNTYKYWLDAEKNEYMYGPLYFGDMPVWNNTSPLGRIYQENLSTIVNPYFTYSNADNVRPVSDMHMNMDNSVYAYVINPTSIAYDNFSVMGEGVSGNIKPYRHDIGALAFPHKGDATHHRIQFIKFLSSADNYKVNFKYDNDLANSYMHHKGTEGLLFGASNFGINLNLPGGIIQWTTLDDNIRPLSTTLRVERRTGTNTGMSPTHDQLSSSRYIKWHSNQEIESNTATNNGFIDFIPVAQRVGFRAALPDYGIGGFSITKSDGLTYHYALPVYNLTQESHSGQTADINNYTKSTMSQKYATTWLLTAITGADFVDRGEVGIIDDADWGYWVQMDYGKFASNYYWSSPYYNAENDYTSSGTADYAYTRGVKETYYLNTIKTRTHTALFIKDLRADGKSYYVKPSSSQTVIYPSSSLKLNEIVLLKNEDFNHLTSTLGLIYNSGINNNTTYLRNGDSFDGSTYNKLLDKYDITQTMRNYIKDRQIKRIVFNYYASGHAHELCKTTLNSFDMVGQEPPTNLTASYSGKRGKLTLESITTYGRYDTKLMPDYLFEYDLANNPNYHIDKWDGWGMYKSNGTHDKDGHKATANGAEWSLQRIITPLGGIIQMTYERDRYASISGNSITETFGGDIRVKQIKVTDENNKSVVTDYVYTGTGIAGGASSGVCSVEPEYIRTTTYAFYNYYDFPSTPVLYGKVTVYNRSGDYLSTFASKTEYNFVTPHQSMIQAPPPTLIYDNTPYDPQNVLKMYNYNLGINTASIGSVLSVKKFNNRDNLLSETAYTYAGIDDFVNQGKFTEGTLICEDIPRPEATYYRLFRTTKIYNPNILKSVTVNEGNSSKTITNKTIDYVTGQVLETEYENSLGDKYKSKIVPAYHKYPEMGPMVYRQDNVTADKYKYKNMLSQTAGNYLYYVYNGQDKVVDAEAETWSKTWTFRQYNTSTAQYEDATLPGEIWRRQQSYVWKGLLDADGTYKSSSPQAYLDFNWSSPGSNTNWKMTNEITRYDQYSKILETKDINGNYVSTKMGHNNSHVIASSNTNYTGFVYSGAEDPVSSGYFSGEVEVPAAYTKRHPQYIDPLSPDNSSPLAHTGKYSIKLLGGENGFTYKGSAGIITDKAFKSGRRYVSRVWLRNINNPALAKLKYELRNSSNTIIGQGEATVSSASTKEAAGWYLLSLEFDIPSNATQVNVFTTNTSTTGTNPVYFDDFRIHPLNAEMTSYVYDERTGLVTEILDNDNFATRYFYDSAGRLMRTAKETLQGFKKTSEITNHYGRQ